MIKNTLFIAFSFILSLQLFGQGVVLLTADDREISEKDTLGVYALSSDGLLKAELFFKNNSEDVLHIWVRKHEIDLVPGTINTFCWNGSCFAPNTYESPDAITLSPGETSTDIDFYGEYYPMDNEGVSIMAYEFFCADEAFDPVTAAVVYVTRNGYDAPAISFNPGDGAEDVAVDLDVVVLAGQPVRHADGSAIAEEGLADLVLFREGHEGGDPVGFTAEMNLQQTMITVVPDEPLRHAATYFVFMDALMGVEGHVSDPQSITFTTEGATDIPGMEMGKIAMYPNPASDVLHLEVPGLEGPLPVRMLDSSGRMVWSGAISGSPAAIHLPKVREGIYFVAVDHPAGPVVRRVTIIP